MIYGKVTNEGKVVIPAELRKIYNIKKGTEVIFEDEPDGIKLKIVPTELDWEKIIDDIPVEDVKIDQNGHYNPKESPDFYDWMVNG